MTRTEDESPAESAAFARRSAGGSCRFDPAVGESCAWYHGLWQDLRAIGLGSSVGYQQSFFARAFALIATRAPRVLVSGAADHAIFASLLEACDALDLDPRTTILDLCDTPLRLNERFAARAGRAIDTVRTDIFDYAAAGSYDAIIAHSFIGYFPPAGRRRLVQHWASMLAPSGVAIVVNRIRSGDPTVAQSFGEREAAAFCAAAGERLRPLLNEADLSIQVGRAAAYVRNHRVHPLPAGELEAHLAAANLGVAIATMITADDSRSHDVGGGVAVASDARYACVAGTRA
jgi:hypothetical protein